MNEKSEKEEIRMKKEVIGRVAYVLIKAKYW